MTNSKSKWFKKRIIWWKATLCCTTKMSQFRNSISRINSRSWIIRTLRQTQLKSGEWRREDLRVEIHRSREVRLPRESRRLDRGKHLCRNRHRSWNSWVVDREVHLSSCLRDIQTSPIEELRLRVRVIMEEIEASEEMVRLISTISFRAVTWIWVEINLVRQETILRDEAAEDNCSLSIRTNYRIKLTCLNKRLVLCNQITKASSRAMAMLVQLLQYSNNSHILASVLPLVQQESLTTRSTSTTTQAHLHHPSVLSLSPRTTTLQTPIPEQLQPIPWHQVAGRKEQRIQGSTKATPSTHPKHLSITQAPESASDHQKREHRCCRTSISRQVSSSEHVVDRCNNDLL